MKLAIVGCGAITRLSHLPAALRSPLIEVHALVDLVPENTAELAREYGLTCRQTTSMADVLGEVQGVLIATPNHTHTAIAAAALSRGIPTLIEKPLTTVYRDAIELCDLADRHHTFISVGYRSRQWRGVHLLKRLIDDGVLGRIAGFDYEVGNTGNWNSVSGYSVRADQAGGGTFIDSHLLDKILYWFGEPVAFTYADDAQGGVEANCKASLTCRIDGHEFPGSFFVSKTSDLRNRIVVRGETYTCQLAESETALPTLTSTRLPDYAFEVHDSRTKGTPPINSFTAQLDEFALAILGKGPVTVDGRFAALSVKWTEAMYANRTQLAEPWVVRKPLTESK